MANPEHVAILRQGADKWNKWVRRIEMHARGPIVDIKPVDLSRANFNRALLQGLDLARFHPDWAAGSGSSFYGVWGPVQGNLVGIDLEEADLFQANMSGADLREASLRGAFLHGATIDQA